AVTSGNRTAEVDKDKVTYRSDNKDYADVSADGTVTVSDRAPIGATVQIEASYAGHKAQTLVLVLYSLEETVLPASSPEAIPVVTNPESVAVVVNKQRSLPPGFVTPDLVEPDVPFSFQKQHEKRKLRRPAAEALEKLFAKAREDNIELRAVSGYRSYE